MRTRRLEQIAFSGEIDDRFLETLYQFPKRLILCSEGGSIYVMSAALDFIEGVGKLEIIGTGCIFSAALPIFASASRRYCTPRTRFMVHDAAVSEFGGKARDLKNERTEVLLANRRDLEVLAAKTKKSRAFWTRLSARTTFFGAEQALKWGLVDRIL